MIKYQVGDKVRLKRNLDKIGEIQKMEAKLEDDYLYGVAFGNEYEYIAGELLMPYVKRNNVEDDLLANNFGQFHDFQKAMTFLKLDNSESIQNNVYAMNTSKTIFYEYQYKPLIKFINSFRRRILICDEVGLGKTIEAGLIMKELDARGELNSVLIVPPANLRVKWMSEMSERFGESFNILHAGEFKEFISGNQRYTERYKKHRFIVSLESIRSDSVKEALELSDFKWDLLIVDEAHSLRNKNKQHGVVKILSSVAESIVFLTATPVHISEANLFNILHIMDDTQYDDLSSFQKQLAANAPIVYALNAISRANPDLELVLRFVREVGSEYHDNQIYQDVLHLLEDGTQNGISVDAVVDIQRNLSELHLIGPMYNRTLKKDVHKIRPKRVPHKVQVEFSEYEKETYGEILDGVRHHYNRDMSLGVLALCRVKQMLSSSLHAHKAKLEKNYELDFAFSDESLLYEENDEIQMTPTGAFWGYRDSKFDKLIEVLDLIKNHTKKVIIFAFFKDTLRYIRERLERNGVECYLLHGDVHISERSQLINEFRKNSGFSILLSSRVGSEGIDLQFCDTLINYDLPWNPMELEQRIGRIDRIGQKSSKIHIYNFEMLNTIDDQIVGRLYERIAMFEGTIGLLEPIMEEVMSDISKHLYYTELSPQEIEEKLDEQERIIKNRLKDIADLETANNELLSLDQFFDREMHNIQKNRRYLSPKQLHQYIAGHIEKNYPESEIRYDAKTQMGSLKLCKEFRKDTRERISDSRELDAFSYGHVKFTFSSEVAYENEDAQFLNILHPLVKAITMQYKELNQIHSCHYFRLRETLLKENEINLSAGYYLYFICVGRITTTRETSVLMPVILNEELAVIGNSDLCEQLIGLSIEEGEPAIQSITIDDKDYLSEAHRVAFNNFKDRFFSYYNRYKARHELMLNRRRESKLLYWSSRISKTQELLDALILENGSPQIITMRKSQIRNYEAKMRTELEEIETDKRCAPDFRHPVYGGIFEVF